MNKANKSEYLQLRVSHAQKKQIKHLADSEGRDMSAWILSKLFPASKLQLEELINKIGNNSSFVFAEINDFLSKISARELENAIQGLSLEQLGAFEQNYLAAMIELACEKKLIKPTDALLKISPLSSPWFASNLEGLKLHLLLNSPAAFRRRNIFIDSSVGDRV